MAVH
jgi:hypothetical protein